LILKCRSTLIGRLQTTYISLSMQSVCLFQFLIGRLQTDQLHPLRML